MIVTCWSVKGGSGTSVVAAALAVAWAAQRPVLAVDLAGDLPAVIGNPTPPGPGVDDWLGAGSGVGTAALEALAVEAAPGLRVLHRGGAAASAPAQGAGRGVAADRWQALAAALSAQRTDVVVDAGLGPPPPELGECTDASLLVIRPCFLALRKASTVDDAPAGVVVISEPGRALGRRDIERVLGIRIAAEMRLDPAVARAVDAGLLASRLPATLTQLAKALDRWAASAAVAFHRSRPEPLPGLGPTADGDDGPVAFAGVDVGGAAAPTVWEGWR